MPRGRQKKVATKSDSPETVVTRKAPHSKAKKNAAAKEKGSFEAERTKSNPSKGRPISRRKQQDKPKEHTQRVKEEISTNDASDASDFDMESSPRIKMEEQRPKPASRSKGRNSQGKADEVKQSKISSPVSSRRKRKKDAVEDENEKSAKKQNVKKKAKTEASVDENTFPAKKQKTKKLEPRKVQARESVDVPIKKTMKAESRKIQARESAKKQKTKTGKNQAKESCGSDCIPDAVKLELKKEDVHKEGSEKKVDLTKRCKEDEDNVEEMSSDDSSESEWEEVEDLPLDVVDPTASAGDIAGPSGSGMLKEPLEISIDVSGGNTLRSKRKQKREEMWRRYLQWEVNKSNKDLQEAIHKVHLLCLLASGLQSSRLCNDMELQCISMSHIPASLMPNSQKKVDYYLPKFFKWFVSSFEIDAELKEKTRQPLKEKLTWTLETRKAATESELVHVCILMLRALGLDVRLVLSLHPVTIKSIKLTKATNKKLSKSKTSKSSPGSKPKASKAAPSSSKSSLKETAQTEPVCSTFFQSPSDKHSGSSKSKQTTKTDSNTSSSKNAQKDPASQDTKTKGCEKNTQKSKQSSQPIGPRPKNRQQRKCASKVKPIIELSSDEEESSIEDYKVTESDIDSDYEESQVKKTSSTKKQSSAMSRKRTKTQSDIKSEHGESEKVTATSNKRKQKSLTGKNKSKISRKNSAGNSSVEEIDSDSDFEVEVIKVASGPRRSSSSGEGSAKKSRKMLSSESDESVEIIKTKGELDKQGTDVWLEVYCAGDGTWICVDCIRGNVKRPELIESHASKPITYVVAFDNDGSMKDITHRYDSKWMIGTQKLRVESEWWQETLQPFRTKNQTRDREEDDLLQNKLHDKPLPTTISEYKNHPLYALKRHLLKFEGLYPETAAILGYCRGEAVYARECVHELHTRQTWLKEARVVRIGEKPYKMVKARPKRNQLQETEPSLEVFGHWQTEDYIPPPAVDGIVPRNEHGNVELFKECMLPKGTVHMQLVGLNRIARKLEIDCAPAMTGWDFHSGFCHPVLDGYVVCEEYEDLLMDAWHKEQQEIEKKKRKKKEERALKNWKLLIKGVLIRERLNKRFQVDQGASTSSPSKLKANKSQKVSWPKNRMTSFEGDKSNRLPFETL